MAVEATVATVLPRRLPRLLRQEVCRRRVRAQGRGRSLCRLQRPRLQPLHLRLRPRLRQPLLWLLRLRPPLRIRLLRLNAPRTSEAQPDGDQPTQQYSMKCDETEPTITSKLPKKRPAPCALYLSQSTKLPLAETVLMMSARKKQNTE